MLSAIKSAAKLVIRPKQFAAAQSYDQRLKFHHFFKWLHSAHTQARIDLLKNLDAPLKLKSIPEDKGFQKIEDMDPQIVSAAHQAARELIKSLDLEHIIEQSETKHLVSIQLNPDGNPDSPFMKLGLHPSIVKMVGNYLGMLPVIENMYLWYSPNREDFERSSQYYHFDAQDVRTLQMFLLVEDVDDNTGPFVFLEAEESERVARLIDYKKAGSTKRIDDDLVSKNSSPEKVHKLIGPAGSLFIADSDRCFHYGSRKASKPRFMLTFQYYTPFAFAIPFKWWKALPYASSPHLNKYNQWQRLVLGAEK